MWLTNLKVGAVGLLVILFYTAVAHVIPQLQSEVPQAVALGDDVSPAVLAATGEQVYNGAGGCTACHGLGTRAPNLLTDYAGQGPIGARCQQRLDADCKRYLHASLTHPGDSVVLPFANIMPDVARQLGDPRAVWALVAFLQAQGGEITVTADDVQSAAAREAPASGGGEAVARSATMDPRQLLQEHACTGCHAIDGAGPPIGPSFDGIGSRISANQIRRGILDPDAEVTRGFEQFAGMMPKTFGQQLSAAQLEAIVQFLANRK